jgi:hypothetical protein
MTPIIFIDSNSRPSETMFGFDMAAFQIRTPSPA